jgi:hypothetical protein
MYRSQKTSTPKLQGSNHKILRFVEENVNKYWSAFNPSISSDPKGNLATTIRSSNYLLGQMQLYTSLTTGHHLSNRVFFAEVTPGLKLKNLREVTFEGDYTRGVEDCRLIWRDGGWHFLGVVLEKHTPVARPALFKFDDKKNVAKLVKQYDASIPERIEKNWGILANGVTEEFDFVYSPEAIYKDGEVIPVNKPQPKLKHLRGGSQLIKWGQGYLGVSHITRITPTPNFNSRTFKVERTKYRDYTHVFVQYDKHGNTVGISDEFIFDIGWVEFAAGLVKVEDKLVISYGVDDASMSFFEVDVAVVKGMLRRV